jgi:hypothetical protein
VGAAAGADEYEGADDNDAAAGAGEDEVTLRFLGS